MSLTKKILCGFMAVLMMFSATACSAKSNEKIVATYKGEEVPAGIYLYGMVVSLNEAKSKLEDKKADVLTTEIDGVKGSEWIEKQAKNFVNKYLASKDLFNEMGLALTVKELETISSTIDSLNSSAADYSKVLTKNGISANSFKEILKSNQMVQSAFPQYYGENGTEPVAESEYKAQFEKMYRRAVVIEMSFKSPTGDNMTDVEKKAVLEKADELFNDYKNGKTIAEVYDAYEKYTGTNLDKKTDDKPTEPKSYLLDTTNVYLPEGLIEELDKAKVGEMVKIESDYSVVLAVKSDIYESTEDYENLKSILLEQLKSDAFDELIQKRADELAGNVEYSENALKIFSAKKIASKNK